MRKRRQQGITLILSLVMLVLMTIMALSSFNIGKSSLQVVDNAQQRQQALNAAQATLDHVLSSPTFTVTPSAVLSNTNCPAGVTAPANSTCVDMYGDGKTVVLVELSPVVSGAAKPPSCLQVKPILNSALDLENAEETPCQMPGNNNAFGIGGLSTDTSRCSETLWEVNAQATEQVSGAKLLLTQGVQLRVFNDILATACP